MALNANSETDIDAFFDGLTITPVIIDYYIDFEDFQNPIKFYASQDNGFLIDKSTFQDFTYKMQKNVAEFQDSALHLFDSRIVEFWSLQNYQYLSSSVTDNMYLRVAFVIDVKSIRYKRVAFSLLDVIANVGGVYEMGNLLIAVLVSLVSKNLMLFEMIETLYYYKKKKTSKIDVKSNFSSISSAFKVFPKIIKKDSNKIEESKSPEQDNYNIQDDDSKYENEKYL